MSTSFFLASLVGEGYSRRLSIPRVRMEGPYTMESEETYVGWLGGDRYIYVQQCAWASDHAGLKTKLNPFHWLALLEAGNFDDPDNYPSVWVQENGKRQWRDKEVEGVRRARNIAWGRPEYEYPVPMEDDLPEDHEYVGMFGGLTFQQWQEKVRSANQ